MWYNFYVQPYKLITLRYDAVGRAETSKSEEGKMMDIYAIDEYNDSGHLIHAGNFPGAFARGKTREEALSKFPLELRQYADWLGLNADCSVCNIMVAQEKISGLQICDADSDVLFETEVSPLTRDEYENLKALALKSAADFLALYESIPDKTGTSLSPRKTFYGDLPLTAAEMYIHTKNVNEYYFGEIGVPSTNEPDIYVCRKAAFEMLETQPGFLSNTVYTGSYDEKWSLCKVCRRFVWHDRIHAKAMYRMATKLCGRDAVENPFRFAL